MKNDIVHVRLESIFTNLDTQMRLATHAAIIEEYAEILDKLPPIVVFLIDERYVLVDGFHRFGAYQKMGRETIPCIVMQGTLDDAREYACCANQEHGLRRNNGDKRKAVETFFRIPGRDALDNSEVARRLGVSCPFVQKVRDELGVKPSPASHHGAGSAKRRLNDLIPESMGSSAKEESSGLNGLIPSEAKTVDKTKTVNVDLPSNNPHQFAVTLLREFDPKYLKSCADNILKLFNQ